MAKKTRIAINGFGRIGRLILRAAIESKRADIEFVAVNDLMPPEQSAFLMEFDSVHGRAKTSFKTVGDMLYAGNHKIKILSEKDPAKLPWKKLDVDIVMECTGIFASADKAKVHLVAGAKRVLVSAPSDGADKTIVFGINEKTLKKTDKIISNGSCTTNCLAPIASVIDDAFGIVDGWMTTVHSYTGDQQLLDKNHSDFRRARAANLSIIPTSTGEAKAIGLVLPKLNGKLNGCAIRVPTPDVSIVELIVRVKKKADPRAVDRAMQAASKGKLKNILAFNESPLVSADFIHDPHSAIYDATQTKVVGDILHVSAWYDNEWGFSNRMIDVAVQMSKL